MRRKSPFLPLLFISALITIFLNRIGIIPFWLEAEAAGYYVTDYGAVGDGRTNDQAAIQAAIDAASNAGGGDVIFNGGKIYYTGNFFIKSNVTLVIEPGSVIQASDWYADYEPQDCDDDNVCDDGIAPLITAASVSNVGIKGGGTIRGVSDVFYCPGRVICDWSPGDHAYGPSLILFGDVSYGRIENVTIEKCNAATVGIAESDHILIENSSIRAETSHDNTDSLNIYASQYVTIRNNYIQSGDDAICLKMRSPYAAPTMPPLNFEDTHDITIEGNTIHAPLGGGALSIGYDVLWGQIYNVWYTNNTITTETTCPIFFKDSTVGDDFSIYNVFYAGNQWENGFPVPFTTDGYYISNPNHPCQRWNIFFNGEDMHDIMPDKFDSAEGCQGPPPHATEDVNQDGIVDLVDVQLCVSVFLGLENDPDIVDRADINNSGRVDVVDVQLVVKVLEAQ
jgi:polygalacturonase